MFFDWHPTVVHDLHESVSLLITWNGTGPTNENVEPVAYDQRLEMSFHEVTTLTGFGMPGVWTWNFGDDSAHCISTPSHSIITPWAAATRPSETARPRPWCKLLPRRDQPGLVPAIAAAERPLPLVGARQSELHGDGGARRARPRRAAIEITVEQFLPTGIRTPGARGLERSAVRVLDPERPGRPHAGRAVGIALASPGHRSASRQRRASSSRKEPIPREPTWCGSTSRIEIMPWTC